MAQEDTQFKPGQSGNPGGRPSRAKALREKHLLPLLPAAVEKLQTAVESGEKWAIELTVSYCLPKPKPIDSEEMDAVMDRLDEIERALKQ